MDNMHPFFAIAPLTQADTKNGKHISGLPLILFSV